jgi:hypothetical protein
MNINLIDNKLKKKKQVSQDNSRAKPSEILTTVITNYPDSTSKA